MMVDEKKSKIKSSHAGQDYFFCSDACKKTFEKDPHKYLGEHHH